MEEMGCTPTSTSHIPCEERPKEVMCVESSGHQSGLRGGRSQPDASLELQTFDANGGSKRDGLQLTSLTGNRPFYPSS